MGWFAGAASPGAAAASCMPQFWHFVASSGFAKPQLGQFIAAPLQRREDPCLFGHSTTRHLK
jgi:hypothetical protein